MSASDLESSIYLSDTDKQIKKKVGNAFSGGQDTREKHKEIGGRTEVDIPFQYLRFFLEDDEELERIRVAYEKGEMESGDMKAACTKELQTYVAAFKERRKAVTDEVRDEFLRPRRLEFDGAPAVGKTFVTREDAEIERLRKEIASLKGDSVDGLTEKLEKA